MDANKLRAEVFEKTGIKVDTTDPVFALVALNEAVLADYAAQHAAELHASVEQLKEQTRQLNDAGERTKRLLLQMGQAVEEPEVTAVPATTTAPVPSARSLPLPLLALAGATALLSAILVGIILMLFAPSRQPAPLPVAAAAPAATPALTLQQQQSIQDGEKFARAWPRLDAKTQAAVKAAMQ